MLAACFGRPCGPWRARPRLPWPPLAAPPCKALRPAGKANMRPLAKKCKPFFDIFSNFLFLPYISGVYKSPEPRQQGGKRPQARPIGRAPALARGQQGEQGRGLLGMGRGALARAYAHALARMRLPARAHGGAPALARLSACACAPMRARLPAHVPARARACARGPGLIAQKVAQRRRVCRAKVGQGEGAGRAIFHDL